MTPRPYCVITPCRDEARFARRTLDSVIAQTEPPALWVIVDDGSKDETPAILAEYAARVPWIRVLRRADRGDRKVGGGVIEAFDAGLETVDLDAFDYVCKLDLDLDLPPGYFAALMDRMEAQPRLGTCSGKAYYVRGDAGTPMPFPLGADPRLVSERIGDDVSVGASKFYRVSCFRQIGGFVRAVMWDGIDTHRCRQRGWIATSWDEPELRFLHLRPMGTSHKSWWTGRARHGSGQYFMGTSPLWLLASAAFRMTRPPLVVGGVAILYGYLRSLLAGAPRYGDAAFRSFLRRYQLQCLLKGKRRATAELDARQASVWNPRGEVPDSFRAAS
ncbi:glycosyl transferase family 2 [Anaeromyxobacter dehalogenans 2CP-1]|uniref:Glycosyl transferase family 2 n=1 Tax=Anaeromyxobacter dehalogenans (strain ATCC BAA-258 / DSM 21875 / 2CP-1) TaxID=455488 RepID=B8JFC3_ANAD2|nr:glycosyltransferase family 2 protein [Anaeromyxobacter dehalogenans]ACL66300.1 glycosyl transferase family 2 [Anaeromyxobacter dehalogenans 2CP-1]